MFNDPVVFSTTLLLYLRVIEHQLCEKNIWRNATAAMRRLNELVTSSLMMPLCFIVMARRLLPTVLSAGWM